MPDDPATVMEAVEDMPDLGIRKGDCVVFRPSIDRVSHVRVLDDVGAAQVWLRLPLSFRHLRGPALSEGSPLLQLVP
jgi:hypothetical protein